MIWDVDSYIVLGEEAVPFRMTGVDLIPTPEELAILDARHERRLQSRRASHARKKARNGTQG